METFDDKKVPLLFDEEVIERHSTQENLCDHALCEKEDLDCGECLFSTQFCTKQLFEQWKLQKIEHLKDE